MAIGGWLGKTLGLPKMEQVIPMVLGGGQPARESAPINLQQTIETADAGSASGMIQGRSGFTGRDLVGGAIGGIATEILQDANWDRWTDFGDVDVSNVCRTGTSAPWTRTSTGCVTVSRKQQAKLKEAVRMFGGPQVARNLGISQQLLQQLLLKTFRARRRGISGADIRAVKRVDRQMHSLAHALGGISSTSKAVTARRSPPKR